MTAGNKHDYLALLFRYRMLDAVRALSSFLFLFVVFVPSSSVLFFRSICFCFMLLLCFILFYML